MRLPTRNVLNRDLHMHGRFGNAEMLRRITDGGAVFDDVHSKLLRSCLEIFFHVGTSKLCMLQHPMPANCPVYEKCSVCIITEEHDFGDAILHGSTAYIDPMECVRDQRIIDAAYESSRTGRTIFL